MADRNYLRGEYTDPEENTALGTAGDFAKTLGSGALNVGSNLAAGGRFLAEGAEHKDAADLARGIQMMFQGGSEAIDDTINPETRKLAASTLTSEEFWAHPVLGTALKATGMLPSIAAIAIPGGLLADATAATLFAAGAGGVLNAGDGVDQFYKTLDEMKDEDLQEQSPKYRALREMMDEEPARAKFNREAQGWGPALNVLFGAVSGAVGPAGVAARGLAGGGKGAVLGATEAGALRRAGVAGAEGVATNAAQEGLLDVTIQNAEMDADLRKEFDAAQAANKALEGGALGGLFGAGVGAAAGRKSARPAKLPKAQEDAIATTDTPDPQLHTGATGQAAKPAEIEPNPQNAPSTTPRDKGKDDPKLTPPKKPVDQTIAVDPALAAAVSANEGAPTAQPTEVAAMEKPLEPMTQRSPNETLDKLDAAEGQADTSTAPVTPEGNAPQLDTGMNVPEAPQSIMEQVKQIGTGGRKAVMVPKNGVIKKAQLAEIKSNPNYKVLVTPRGRFIYDNRLTGPAEIKKLSAEGRENELLALGPVPKTQVVADVQAGATPGALTERTPAGVEVKGVATSDATLPEQAAALEATKTPGNVIALETIEGVTEKRNAAGGRILDANTQNVKNRTFEENEARAAAADEERLAKLRKAEAEERGDAPSGPGTNYRGQRGRDRDAAIAAAKEAVERNPPNEEKEKGAHALPAARAAIVARARAMVEHYEKKLGKQVQSQIKESKKGDAASDSAEVLTLRIAKDLVRNADKNSPQINAIITDFQADEFLISKGMKDEVIKRRLEQGNRAKQQHGGSDTVERSKADESDLDEQGNVVKAGLDEDAPPAPDEKTDDEAPSLETGAVSSVDADTDVTPDGNLTEYEAKDDEIKQGPSVKHIEVKAEKAKPTMSAREARKAALAGVAQKGAPNRPPMKNAIERAAASGVDEATYRKLVDSLAKDEAREKAVPTEDLSAFQKEKRITQEAIDRFVQKEALRVDRNPTPAQAKAGNYKKGHRVVEGLPFTIETPAGATRRGFDADGNVTWTAKMPAGVDYGYFKRTLGADGDHIDGYDLRTGDRIFIVDQLDNRTGEFDEHKVFVRAKDEAHVLATYRASFSDGRADERLGNLYEVTRPELHEWASRPQTEPVTKTLLDRDMDTVNFDVPEGPTKKHVAMDGTEMNPVKSTTAEAMLKEMDISQVPGIHGVVSRFAQNMLLKLAKNVEVHLVNAADMQKLSGVRALGLHMYDSYDYSAPSVVYISTDAKPTGYGVGTRNHALIHELIHAVTSREINTVPKAMENIEKLMETVLQAADPETLNTILNRKGDIHYGFTNAHEFMAEALSNQKFQEFLATVPIDRRLANELGIHPKGRTPTAWDMVRHWVKKAIANVTGVPPNFDSALDGILRVGDVVTSKHMQQHLGMQPRQRTAQALVHKEALKMVDDAQSFVRNFISRPENNTLEGSVKMLRLRTFNDIAQLADNFFGENNPVRRVHNAIEKMRIRAEGLVVKAEPIIRGYANLRASNPEQYRALTSLQHDATLANVHPDVPLSDARNAHLGKKRIAGDFVWQKAQHAELAKRYSQLSPEAKDLWKQAGKYFADQQNMMATGITNNQILKLFGVKDGALAERIRNGSLTDADRTLLGGNLEIIEEAAELAKIEGYYVPLIRRGDFVVQADQKITLPGNAKPVRDGAGNVIPNEMEFTTAKEAEDYAKASPSKASIEIVHLDPATGQRLAATELASVDRYRVSVANRHVEFVQGERAARARAAELAQDGSLTVHPVVPRRGDTNARQGAELSTALNRLVKKLERSDAYEAASPTERATMRRAIEEAALSSHGSTRISSRSLPRRGVKGYSEDSIKNTADYAQASSRYIARLEHAAELEAGMKDMDNQLGVDHAKAGLFARTQIANEVRQRVEGDNGFEQGGVLAPYVKRALSASFTDKLGSPAYSIINAMQPFMITMPYLVARYGVGRSFSALGKAYADIQAKSIAGQGAKGTLNQFAKRGGAGDLMGLVKANLNADERAMIDAHLEIGTIDASAGMEVADLAKDYTGVGGKVDAALGYLEGVVREMPKAVETISRSATALSTYRLARAAGESHAQAIQTSMDAVNNTQFNYSPTNAPPVFNHPLLKIALQFKKYGQGMYQLIGSQIGRAMRNAKPGDRAEAVKTLIGIAGTHMAMAGALGLPTEPFKYLLMGAQLAGLPVGTWSDVEDKVRKAAAATFGATGGEAFSRGLPRLLGLDLSRMGLDSITSFGEPRGKKESDVKAWLLDSVSGPVVSLGFDYGKGIQHIANGEYGQAAEKMIPLKAASDSLRAYRQATEGKKTPAGMEKSAPYTPTEAGLRALGFGNAREAEEGAKSSKFYRESGRAKEERTSLINKWTSASPTEKTKAWAAIQKWNQTANAEQKITPKELTDKSKRDAKAAKEMVLGIKPNKRDKRFLEEGAYYNVVR
jgi:hypothetical protein